MKTQIECDGTSIEFDSLEDAREKLPDDIGGHIAHNLPDGRCVWFPPNHTKADVRRKLAAMLSRGPIITLAHEILHPEFEFEVKTLKHITETHVVHASSEKEALRKTRDGRYNPGASVEIRYDMDVLNIALKEDA